MDARIVKKIRAELARLNGGIPYLATTDTYDDKAKTNINWWTNGFFAGILWQMYQLTGEKTFRVGAENIEHQLDQALDDFTGLDHDLGFMWLHTAVADYRLTGNEAAKVRGLKAANYLAGRFNLAGKFIQAWNHQPGWTIIDSMMNISLLFWASAETKNPRYWQIALAHADTLMTTLVRPDGSVGHIAEFNVATGEFIQQLAGQGFDAASAWSRGQAWAIYGYALAYHHTKEERYLITAQKVSNYFIANVSQTNYLTLADFRAPLDAPVKYDSSAGVAAACGLLELADLLSPTAGKIYSEAAKKIISATTENWLNLDEKKDGLVQFASHSYHNPNETHVSLIYGDYFYLEALLRLEGQAAFLW